MADPRMLRLLVKTLGITLLLFAILGSLGWYGLDRGLALLGWQNSLFEFAGGLRGVASFVLVLIAGWLLWRIIAMAVIEFHADEAVQLVEQRYYPAMAAQARDLPLREQLNASLAAAGRALIFNLLALPFALALLVTGIGTAVLFWAVNAVLIGRELSDMVWLRHRPSADEASPIGAGRRFLLGGVIAALLLVPIVSFIAPLLGAASATHLTHRNPRTIRA